MIILEEASIPAEHAIWVTLSRLGGLSVALLHIVIMAEHGLKVRV
jgi:hypothetical protein